jgi:exopolysaccharide biosynthesis polyprenyl glycosylphosphotransferase
MALTDPGVEPASTLPVSQGDGWIRTQTAAPSTGRISPKAWLILADACTVWLAMLVAYAIRASVDGVSLDGTTHLGLGLVSMPVWLWAFAHRRAYNARFINRRLDEVRRLGGAAAFAVAMMTVAAYVLELEVSRAWLGVTFAGAVAMITVEREIIRRLFAAARKRGRMLRRVVIVGGNEEAEELAEMLQADTRHGYVVVDFVDVTDSGDTSHGGPVAQTLAAVRRTGASSVILAASSIRVETSNRLVRELLRDGVHVELSSTLRDIAADRLTVRPLGRFPVVYVEPCESTGWRAFAKRAFDITVASVCLVATAPVALIIGIAIKLDSRGPVIYRQRRVGKNGEVFAFQKFRSMCDNAHEMWIDLREQAQCEANGPIFKLKNDPRVTRVGRILRKTSLDELPQLWNVLRGEMSLVGPRPALPEEMSMWSEELHDRLRVRPGITGMWQVSGRSDAAIEEYTRLDLYYVDNWSLLTDLVIMMKTVPVVLFGRGAY